MIPSFAPARTFSGILLATLAATGLLLHGPALADKAGKATKHADPAASAPTPREEMPEAIAAALSKHCFECHDGLVEKGGVDLDRIEIDWGEDDELALWRKTHNVLAHRQMPPLDRPQPEEEERRELLAWLDERLAAHSPFGGGAPRRLNRLEYRNSIRTVFQMDSFELPPGFPPDTRSHGFDTLAETLVLSPPLLEAYQTVAAQIADELFPPERPAPSVTLREAGVEDLVLSFSAATVHGDALRLVSRSVDIMRSSTWPSKIEINDSGTYRITVVASAFRPAEGQRMTLEVRARDLSASDRSRATAFRLLQEIEITEETPQTFTFDAELHEGQTPLLRWTDAELDHDPENFAPLLRRLFEEDARFLAAWQETLFPGDRRRNVSVASLRGRNGWEILQRHYADPELNLVDATLDAAPTLRALRQAEDDGAVRNLADTLTYRYHENGPALQIHRLSVEGPFEQVEGPRDRQRREWREWNFLVRKPGESDADYANRALGSFLPRLFRRPVDAETRATFLAVAQQHWDADHRFEDGMHLLLRTALLSPRFLYRETEPGELDQHALAARLAFFLTRHPPTASVVHRARAGELSDPAVYRSEAEGLLPASHTALMVVDFTEQWLQTRLLPEIMPDEAFAFGPEEVAAAKAEAERFFYDMVAHNRPLADFIDPPFLLTTPGFASEIYGYEAPAGEGGDQNGSAAAPPRGGRERVERLPIPRGGRIGGLLGMSAVMTATANGVDTQPVLRGAWFVEHLLGTPLPPVPSDVPALTPDTRGATTPRELLSAHTEAADCRGCHAHIDPIGFALENFDPVGRWRDTWPGIEAPIEPGGVLPDGTEIAGFVDLKRWLAGNIEIFGHCLAEKLIIYATGRAPSYAEKQEIDAIVDRVIEEQGGFRDLLLALVESRTFRTR